MNNLDLAVGAMLAFLMPSLESCVFDSFPSRPGLPNVPIIRISLTFGSSFTYFYTSPGFCASGCAMGNQFASLVLLAVLAPLSEEMWEEVVAAGGGLVRLGFENEVGLEGDRAVERGKLLGKVK